MDVLRSLDVEKVLFGSKTDVQIILFKAGYLMLIALVGNQNCGKTTLFNALTGSNQHVGNFPGVTVEKKEGLVLENKDMLLVDLPGLYSLSPYSSEEELTRNFLLYEKPDCILNIADATNLERSLYLSLQLFELQIPTVLALNRIDAAKAAGMTIDVTKLTACLGVPVVPISASQKLGLPALVKEVQNTVSARTLPRLPKFDSTVQSALQTILNATQNQTCGLPPAFRASKLFEEDPTLPLSEKIRDKAYPIAKRAAKLLATEPYAALADARYAFIENICQKCVKRPNLPSKEERISERLDRLLTGKYTAYPLFLLIMAFIFFCTFVFPGGMLTSYFTAAIDSFIAVSERFLHAYNVTPALCSLIVDGVFTGIGSVLSFLPTILTLFFFLSLLEDSGYMARVAFIMDKPMRALGLSGKTFVPLLIGFGCSVPAVMSARTVASEKERKKALLFIPFVSCSAKLPIYVLFTGVFFPQNPFPVIASLYLGGVVVGILVLLFFRKSSDKPESFLLELPTYRLPTVQNTLTLMVEKAKDFLVKAFTVIFLSTVILWFLQSFGFSFTLVADSSESILAAVGKVLAPLFAPLGFAHWKAVTALITGLSAKEAVISSLKILADTSVPFETALRTEFSSLASVLSFLTFTLLYMPCAAATAAFGRELSSFARAFKRMLFQTGIAWLCAFFVYHVTSLFL